jgi:hypothetical protein
VVCIIDDAENIQRFLPTLELMLNEGLTAISDVEVIRYTHREANTPVRVRVAVPGCHANGVLRDEAHGYARHRPVGLTILSDVSFCCGIKTV